MTYRWVDSQSEFEALIDRLCAEPRYALDTEFHRERTYFPKLALMQFATGGETTLVDPLAVDLAPLRRLFASEAVAVLHAAQQDLDVLTHACGAVPAQMYDTQLASGFLGYSTPSLVSLLMAELKVSAAKGDRLTDWLRRPLTDEQLAYAAADVDHLLALQDQLDAQIDELGRSEWVAEACEELRQRPVVGYRSQPGVAADQGRAHAQAAGPGRRQGRLRVARASGDVGRRAGAPDPSRSGRAGDRPAAAEDHPSTSSRLVASRNGTARATSARRSSTPWPTVSATTSSCRPPTARSSIGTCARRWRWCRRGWPIWPASSASTPACWRPGPTSWRCCAATTTPACCTGWRAELVGDGIQRLVQGKAGLTFDGRGGLRLIDVADVAGAV